MGVLRVGFDASAELKLERIHFEGAEEIEARLPPRTSAPPEREGPPRVAVSCVWSAQSLVSERMTPVEDLVAVAPEDTIDEADVRASAAHVHHLPVFVAGSLVGEICGCDLRSSVGHDAVVQHMRRDVYAISITATVTEAARAMSRLGVGSLFVFDGPKLSGVLTRSDLRRVGAPDEAIDGARCVACGSGHGVRPDEQHDGLVYCPNCTDAESQLSDAANFGEGD